MKHLISAATAVFFLAFAGVASAATSPTLTGGATLADGVITLVSNTGDTATANDYSSATFTLPAGMTFSQLQTLEAVFNTTDDGCAGGSPRVTLHLASGKNVWVYLGQAGNLNTCALNTWIDSGNLIGNNDVGRYDTSQVQSGTQVSTYAAALQLLGSQVVTSVSFDVDGGWAMTDKEQTVQLKSFSVNNLTFPAAEQPSGQNAAKLCKAQRAADPAGFRAHYGTNHNKANAFGKCVSGMNKAIAAGTSTNMHKRLVASFKAHHAHHASKHANKHHS